VKRLLFLAVLTGLITVAAAAQAQTQVSVSGDARIYATFWSKYQYTNWNFNGTQTWQSLNIFERFRLKTDFVANEDLKFRLGIRIDDGPTGNAAWGHATFTIDNPDATSIQVYQAYMQFNWPNTDVQFTIGYQDFDLPFSADWLGANPVMGGTDAAAAVVEIPVIYDHFQIKTGFSRLLDASPGFQQTTTQQADRLDAYFLTLPISLEDFKATPWGMVAVAGRDAGYGGISVGQGPYTNETLATNLFSAGGFSTVPLRNAQNAYWWAGTTVTVSSLDFFKFYGDVIYGSGNDSDRKINRRQGLFFDVAAEYTDLDYFTPQVTFWYSTGEDKSLSNGSERLPCVVNYWGPTSSFLFNTTQEFNYGFMGTNSIGSWGLVAGLEKISLLPDLTNRLVFTYARGTNSPAGLRAANLLNGVGNYVQMGRDLTSQEYELAVNLDTKYDIYQNLAAIAETGWSHGDFQTSVWTHRFTSQTRNGDAWKVAVGLRYQF